MTLDPHVIATLRKMFAEGATPSRLIQYIADYYGDAPEWTRYVQHYFWAAFSVVVLDMENQPADWQPDVRNSMRLNTDVLHEMVGRVHHWREQVRPMDAAGQIWFDELTIAPDELSLVDNIKPELHPHLCNSWLAMKQPARDCVRQALVNAQAYYEKTQILARLVEQLQQQVIDLERQAVVAAEQNHNT